ncbi:uncharacterized protein LOC134821743 [Bolinopsis microptera]|uniref:uncharacterized protein LOC134821743 n=1 Tax=Bolinopsis microptera TaxID=2820187 RepID=UPI00307A5A14
MEFTKVLEALKDQMGERHMMLSYQWDNQELVAKVYDIVSEHNINVWMDIHGGVTGNINEAMASGVEGSAVVCCFMTQKYEKSKNCSAELNYANDRGVVVVPCMAQNRTEDGNPFRASGWLGILTAGKLWLDFKSDEQLEKRIVQLLTECCARLCKSETPVGKMVSMESKMSKKKAPVQRKKKVRGAAAGQAEEGTVMVLPDERSITVPLNQPLEPGDQIEVWGLYEYGEKFNFNLIGDDLSQILLHFDIRPTENVVVMNNKVNDQWQTEIRDNRVVRKFERGEYDENFNLIVKYDEDKLVFFINGDKMRKSFPIRVPLKEGRNVVLRDEDDLGRWKKLKVPAPRVTQESKGTSDVKLGEEMILEQSLAVGDCIEVWGKHQEGDNYSFNIMRGKGDYLFHFDVRPKEGIVCLDSIVKTQQWTGSLNLHLEDLFKKLAHADPSGNFHIKIEFAENKMILFVNEMLVEEYIPYAFDLDTATHVVCFVPPGSNENPWKKISLPKPRQILQSFGTYEFKSLSIGDVINFTGHFRKEEDRFDIKIIEDPTSVHLHISIRPLEGVVVLIMNIRDAPERVQEISAAIPDSLAECELFDLFVLVEEKNFRVEFFKDGENEKVLLEMKMNHKNEFANARYVSFHDVQSNVWTELNMPDGTTYIRDV